MTFVTKSYPEITDSILSYITKGVVKERHDFVANCPKYKLDQPADQLADQLVVSKIICIDATVFGNSRKFEIDKDGKSKDFKLDANMVEWIDGGDRPDDGTPFFVSYELKPSSGDTDISNITDINPGSVINTIIESIALELDYLYSQMDQVYDSAFIDTTSGKSMDLVAALLGITRISAKPATGQVTFSRSSDPDEIKIDDEPITFDGDLSYELNNTIINDNKDITINGISNKNMVKFVLGKDFTIQDNVITWIKNATLPDTDSIFNVAYTAYESILIPSGTLVSTLPKTQENAKTYKTTEDAFLSKRDEKWEVDVPIIALSPGKEGNVASGAIVSLMPKPVAGIERVINKMAITNGYEAEDDLKLRERVKHYIEMEGKATNNALKLAIQNASPAIGYVEVKENNDIPGLVNVLVSINADKNEIDEIKTEIRKAIEDTRAAGIKVDFDTPKEKSIDISMTISIDNSANQTSAENDIESAIKKYFTGLKIGEGVLLSQIFKAAINVSGVTDVKASTKPEDLSVGPGERAILGKIDFKLG